MIIGKKQIDKLRISMYAAKDLAQAVQSGQTLAQGVMPCGRCPVVNQDEEELVNDSLPYYDKQAVASSATLQSTQIADRDTVSIAIDGPAGTGKSTIAKKLAQHYGYLYFSTGTLYRSLAYACLHKNIDINCEPVVCAAVKYLDLRYEVQNCENGKSLVVYLDNQNITPQLHTEIISIITPTVAKYPLIREHFRKIQRGIAASNDIVMEGRDICSVVLPNATHKFYLTASAEVRAKRRFAELIGTEGAKYDEILAEIKARDKADSERDISPLKCANDAIKIDNSDMNIAESVQAFCEVIDGRENCAVIYR